MERPKVRVIGLVGAKGSGKSTAYQGLTRYQVCPLASPLKKMLSALGLPYESIHGADKEKPLDMLYGKTARHAMQTLGTEWGRQHIGENFWLDRWWDAARTYISGTLWRYVIVDDVRFLNEATYLRNKGATIIRVVRPGYTGDGHASETEQANIVVDATLNNVGTVEELHAKMREAVSPINDEDSP